VTLLSKSLVRLSEIEIFTKKIDVPMNQQKIKRLLFLLNKFLLIIETKRGHDIFYFAIKKQEYLTFSGRFDPISAKISAMQYYTEEKSESRRVDVIKANNEIYFRGNA
jgi:hypothetical protein